MTLACKAKVRKALSTRSGKESSWTIVGLTTLDCGTDSCLSDKGDGDGRGCVLVVKGVMFDCAACENWGQSNKILDEDCDIVNPTPIWVTACAMELPLRFSQHARRLPASPHHISLSAGGRAFFFFFLFLYWQGEQGSRANSPARPGRGAGFFIDSRGARVGGCGRALRQRSGAGTRCRGRVRGRGTARRGAVGLPAGDTLIGRRSGRGRRGP